ncbi:MAG: hypothetical protein N2V75_04945 [Methanophagales archaeon]|nr:hypothetical protein [Methanophagales archaeon]
MMKVLHNVYHIFIILQSEANFITKLITCTKLKVKVNYSMARRIVKGGNKTLKRETTSEEVEKFQRSVKDYWAGSGRGQRSSDWLLYNLEIEEITGIDEKNVRLWINRL